jgi:hypothetical protein
VNRRKVGWVAFWSLAVPLAAMGANCDNGSTNAEPVGTVTNRSEAVKSDGTTAYQLTIEADNGTGATVVVVSERGYRNCPRKAKYPACLDK